MARMLSRIRDLIESVRTKEEEKRRMELNWLQAQINPHFMYNTLFSIKCSVDMGRNDEAGHMLTTFIQMLRGILSVQEEMVTVQAQMDALRQYVELQQFRYDGSFDALIECDDQAAGCRIPKLLIQPLVENAILHGVDMAAGDGMITVVARRVGEAISIQVEDNGVGMTEARIQEVMRPQVPSDRPHLESETFTTVSVSTLGATGACTLRAPPAMAPGLPCEFRRWKMFSLMERRRHAESTSCR